jgi:hypothetical protein
MTEIIELAMQSLTIDLDRKIDLSSTLPMGTPVYSRGEVEPDVLLYRCSDKSEEKTLNRFVCSNCCRTYKTEKTLEKHNQLKKCVTKTHNDSNMGTGAGGSNTNKNGKKFERQVSNEKNLEELGFCKVIYFDSKKSKRMECLTKYTDDYKIIYLTQGNLKKYLKEGLKIDIFRNPDESYLIIYNDGRLVLKIVEMKFQRVSGSVIDKMMGAPFLRDDYKKYIIDGRPDLLNKVDVNYMFCINTYIDEAIEKNNKKFWESGLEEKGIIILRGDKDDYYDKLNAWLGFSSL